MKIKKVLLIEKDPSLRGFLKDQLSKKGLEVHPVKGVRDGVLTGIVARPQIIFYNRIVDHEDEPLKKAVSKVACLEGVPAVPYDFFPSTDPARADAGREDLLESLMLQLQLDEGLTEESTDPTAPTEERASRPEKRPPAGRSPDDRASLDRLEALEGFRKEVRKILARRSVDITQRLDEILSVLRERFGLDQADLYLLETESKDIVLQGSTGPLRRFIGQVRFGSKSGILADAFNAGIFLSPGDARQGGAWREVYFPVKVQDRTTGVLVLQRGSTAANREMGEGALDEIARYLGEEIEKEITREQTEQKVLKLSTLNEKGLSLLALSEVDQITSAATTSAALLLGAEAVVLRLHEKKVWWVAGSFGLDHGPESKKLFELDEMLVREQVVSSSMPLILNDVREAGSLPPDFRFRTLISTPIKQGERWIGVLSLYNKMAYNPLVPPVFALDDHEVLSKFAGYLARALSQARNQEVQENMPGTDALTGLKNQIYFRNRLNEEVERAGRHDRKLGLIVVEIDRFGDLAGALGENASNELVQKVGLLLNETFRNVDVVARLSEGRFGVILPDTGDRLMEGISRLERKISGFGFRKGREKPVAVGFLIGWSYFPDQATNPDDLLKRASKLSALRISPSES